MAERWNSSSSPTDSNTHPSLSAVASVTQTGRKDYSIDLRLGLSLSSSSSEGSSPYLRNNLPDWPPIKPVLRSALAGRGGQINHQNGGSFFVKVYMEGNPIGRKLDLFSHDCYQGLIKSLQHMFRATIIRPDHARMPSSTGAYVLTYEDREGDWMMVGDVPWEFFLTTVKKLRIRRADKC